MRSSGQPLIHRQNYLTQINEAVYLALQECGIEIYQGYTAIDVQLSSHHFLQAVKLENKLFDSRSIAVEAGNESEKAGANFRNARPHFVTLECTTLLCCARKSCDADIFAAINESGLVYDGGVVVDEVSNKGTLLTTLYTFHLTPIVSLICPLSLIMLNLFCPQHFRTVDPCIYAIGNYTRFSRVYRDAIPHSR